MLNSTPIYVIESCGVISMSLMKIFGNAGCIFIFAEDILISFVFIELSIKSYVVSQLCKSVGQLCKSVGQLCKLVR